MSSLGLLTMTDAYVLVTCEKLDKLVVVFNNYLPQLLLLFSLRSPMIFLFVCIDKITSNQFIVARLNAG